MGRVELNGGGVGGCLVSRSSLVGTNRVAFVMARGPGGGWL